MSDVTQASEGRELCMADFQVGPILGTGSFGRVSLAKCLPNGMTCAIKALSKAHVVKNQQVISLFDP